MTEFVFLIHLTATAFMVGVIWLVQLVHYPAFKHIEEKNFKEFAFFHQQKITYIVAPAMVIEFLSGLYLLPATGFVFTATMMMLIAVWLVTFFYSVKEHNLLLSGKDEESIDRLVKTNWIRTLLWTGRLIILFFIA